MPRIRVRQDGAQRRPPVPVIVAAVLTGILNSVGCFGLVYFGLFVGPEVNPDAGSRSAVTFAAVGLVSGASARPVVGGPALAHHGAPTDVNWAT